MAKLPWIATEVVHIYLDKRVSRASAALAYFLMLSIFPTLVCLYEMLGNLFPTSESIVKFISGIVPSSTIDTIIDYLGYVTENQSHAMVTIAIVAMVTTSSAAYRTIDQVMGEIRGKSRFTGGFAVIFSFVFSLIFLAAIYFAAIIMVSGKWLLNIIAEHITFIHISDSWNWMRFVILFLMMLAVNLIIYRVTAPRGKDTRVFTGAMIGAGAFVVVGLIFSFFIGMSVKYPLIYGSLASAMILLFWLYICGNIVYIGNIINVVVERMNTENGDA